MMEPFQIPENSSAKDDEIAEQRAQANKAAWQKTMQEHAECLADRREQANLNDQRRQDINEWYQGLKEEERVAFEKKQARAAGGVGDVSTARENLAQMFSERQQRRQTTTLEQQPARAMPKIPTR